MILLILGFCILVAIGGVVMVCTMYDDEAGWWITAFGGIGVIISIIAACCLGYSVSKLRVIDDKIAMYQEENTRIEEQISEVVEQYQTYETEIFTEVKPESSMTLVALYPELKSDSLVQKQIEVYTSNNQKIKELKESKINGSVTRWWLYFGK